MEIVIENKSETEREMTITLSAEELLPKFDEAYKEYQPKLNLKGFRPGRVPMTIVKKMFGTAIERDALGEIMQESFRSAIEERSIMPLGTPVLFDEHYEPGTSAIFKLRYEVAPEIQLADYRSIVVQRHVHSVTDKELEHEQLRLRQSNGTTSPAEEVTDDQYIVTVDMQERSLETDTPVGKPRENIKLYLGDVDAEPQYLEALMNAKAGDIRRVTLTHTHGDHEHTNLYEMKVNVVERFTLPDFDAALVEKITAGKQTDVAAFNEQLRKDLQEYWNKRLEEELDDSIARTLVERHEFTPPNALVEEYTLSMLKDSESRQPQKKFPKNFDVEGFRKSLEPYAVYQSKRTLLFDQITRKEQIDVTDADVEALVDRDAARIGIDREKLLEYYKTDERTRNRVINDKLMAFLRSNVTIEDVAEAEHETNPTTH